MNNDIYSERGCEFHLEIISLKKLLVIKIAMRNILVNLAYNKVKKKTQT